MERTSRAVLVLAAAATLVAAGQVRAGDAEKPFVADHTAILANGAVYRVEGHVRIGKGVEITVQKDTRLVGGKDAVIEVEGQLEIHGVADSLVTLENVTIEVQPKFQDVHIDMVVFSGASRGVVSPKDKAVDGRIFVSNTEFQADATVDVTMSGNAIDLQRIYVRKPVRVRGVTPEGQKANAVKLGVYNNCGGTGVVVPGALQGGLLVENVGEVTVRTNVLNGAEVAFTDCGAVTFDGNAVRCRTVRFVQIEAGRFGRSQVQKCDFTCDKIVVSAPAVAGRGETLKVDKCWFNGETDEKVIREKFITDHDDDPKCGVTADITKIMEKPLELAGKVKK